jgi:hypothetical protein
LPSPSLGESIACDLRLSSMEPPSAKSLYRANEVFSGAVA